MVIKRNVKRMTGIVKLDWNYCSYTLGGEVVVKTVKKKEKVMVSGGESCFKLQYLVFVEQGI